MQPFPSRVGARPSVRRRAAALLLGTMFGAATLFAVGVAGVAAYVGECNDSQLDTTVSNLQATWVMTHDVVGVSIAPGSSFTRSITESLVTTITASVNYSTTVTAEASAVIAKASAAESISLKLEGAQTTSTSITKSWSFTNTSTSQRQYGIMHYTKKVTGQYAQRTCSRTEVWQAWRYGSFVTWQSEWDASALCPRTRYATTSPEYKGLLMLGC